MYDLKITRYITKNNEDEIIILRGKDNMLCAVAYDYDYGGATYIYINYNFDMMDIKDVVEILEVLDTEAKVLGGLIYGIEMISDLDVEENEDGFVIKIGGNVFVVFSKENGVRGK